jgi:hypothetical protein
MRVHIQENNPLASINFTIVSNVLEVEEINNNEVQFSDNTVSFSGCNANSVRYNVGEDHSISF